MTTEQIAFRRCRVLLVPTKSNQAPTPELGAATVAELRHAGLALVNPQALTVGCAEAVARWAAWSRAERGEQSTYTPLFRGFPDQLPTYDLAELRFGIGLVRLAVTALRQAGAGAASWKGISDADLRAAMDFSGIGWWPASSVPQDVETARLDRYHQGMLPGDELRRLTPVTLVNADELDQALHRFAVESLTSPVSLRRDVREDLDRVLDQVLAGGREGLPEVQDVPFLETRALLLRRVWHTEPSALSATEPTPDDVLRLFAELTGGDVSLAEPVRYPRLTRAQRRAVVTALEASPRLSDVFRRRGLWLAIARGLHPHEFDAPRVNEVFARLRADRRDTTSLPSRREALFAKGEIAEAAELLAAEAPGLLIRSLRRLVHAAETAGQTEGVLAALTRVVGEVPPRLLWVAYAQFRDNGATYPRLAITKKGDGLAVPGPVGHLSVPQTVADRVLKLLLEGLTAQAVAREAESELHLAGAGVWIDPALETVLLPDQLRSTAPGLVQVERGSRLALGSAEVLRLFIHWKEPEGSESDLDLSVMALNHDLQLVAHVSWTELANQAMTHSGDLTSAPDGAEEFVDVRLDHARSQAGWRYLVPAVYRYAGPDFAGLDEAVVGWMLRDQPSADHATFDPATVVNAFALTGRRPQALPILVDLATDEVTYIDLYTGEGYRKAVENTHTATADLVAGAIARAGTRMTVADVVRHGVSARGGSLTDERERASVTVGLDEQCTFDVRSPQELLVEFL